jgi:hypothetical protein
VAEPIFFFGKAAKNLNKNYIVYNKFNKTKEKLSLQSQLSTLINFFELRHLNYNISIKETSRIPMLTPGARRWRVDRRWGLCVVCVIYFSNIIKFILIMF